MMAQRRDGVQKRLDIRELFKTIGWLGAAMALAGYIRYSVQNELLLTSKILLLAGGALFLAGIVVNFRALIAFFSLRSSKLGTNTAVVVLAVVAILGLLNFLGYRHHKRFDLTAEKLFTLSDQTQRVVMGLKRDVQILRFAKTPDPRMIDLLGEYVNLNRKISYTRVDPQERPEVAKQYGVTRMGQVIVASGPHIERLENTEEQDITSAILKATRNTVKTVCFVEGHGERSTSSNEGDGYSAAAGELKRENYEVKRVNLVSEDQVPSDCSVLVEAGPTKALFPQEAAMIGKYLDGGGKALILVDPQSDPKLDDIFQAWNIAVGNNVVIDISGVGRLLGMGPAYPLVVDYGTHQITRNFEHTMTFFALARTVSLADKTKTEPSAIELLKTSPRSFALTDLAELKSGRVTYDPKRDQSGPLSLGVAASRTAGSQNARLVVIGNSAFATNQFVGQQRNGDLFFNAINWLAQDEDLISIRPKSPANRRITLTEAQQRGLYWFSLVLLPGLVIVSGIFIWWKRR
jgi:gliding motility-associatede transport system auxiliary component